MRRLIIIGALIVIPVFAVGLIISGVLKKPVANVQPVTLTYWTVQDEPDWFADVIKHYRSSRPYVKIEVVKQRPETYADALIQAWARDQGPDIFSIPNDWIGKYQDLIEPMPAQLKTYVYKTQRFLFQKRRVATAQITESLTVARLANDFADVVSQDVVRSGKIYALPLSVDTLAVYYNRDLLNRANIPTPAATWRELVDQAPKLTLLDSQSRIIQSAIALGLADNVAHAPDILSLLMLQNGTQMTDTSGRSIQFQRGNEDYQPGVRALEFYTDFSDPAKEVYSWSDTLPNSIDAFVNGRVAYLIGTLSDQSQIEGASETLRYGTAPIFHLNEDGTDTDGRTNQQAKINFASYWVETVAQRSAHPNEAWDFLQYLSRAGVVESYLDQSDRISALRKVLAKPVATGREAFAGQVLTAASWYHGEDAPTVETALAKMVADVAAKTKTASQAIAQAAKEIQLTYTAKP